MKKIVYCTIVLLCISLASCTRESSKTSENKNTPQNPEKKQEEINSNTPLADKKTPPNEEKVAPEGSGKNSTELPTFTQKVYKRTYKNCDEKKDDCTNIQVYYPVMSGSSYADKINAMIKEMALYIYPMEGTKYNEFDKVADAYFKDYEEFRKEVPDAPSTWYLKDSTSIVYNSADIFCFENISESYLGGAHGSYNVAYTNIDMRNGNVLKSKDIFNKGYEKTLNKLIEQGVRKHLEIKPNESLTDGGLFDNKISFNDNFAITAEGLEFLYNQYEIAPYALGVIEIKLSYKDLDAILNKTVLNM